MLTLSILQPACEILVSLPIRQRKTTLWPDMEPGRLTVVVTKPLVAPVQAERPASGLPKLELIVSL
jgi:hypothetical protein